MDNQKLSQKYIIESLKTLLETKKYEDISVCEICKNAGVSRMSFYRSFNSKDELTNIGFEIILDKIKENINKNTNINIYIILKECFEIFKNYKNIISSFDGSEIFQSIITNSTNNMVEKFNIDFINKSSKFIPLFYLSGIFIVIIHWLRDGAKESPDEMARLLAPLINPNVFTNDCFL